MLWDAFGAPFLENYASVLFVVCFLVDFGYNSVEVLWMSIAISVLRGQGRAQRGRRPLDMLGLFLRVSSNAKRVHVSLLHS